jgi:hypothetical protein
MSIFSNLPTNMTLAITPYSIPSCNSSFWLAWPPTFWYGHCDKTLPVMSHCKSVWTHSWRELWGRLLSFRALSHDYRL